MAESIEELQAFKCLAQPTRLAIVLTLFISGKGENHELNFNQLKNRLHVNSSLLDHHLKMLVRANLVGHDIHSLEPKKSERIRTVVGTHAFPSVIGILKEANRSYSYYMPTELCRETLHKVGLDESRKMQETLTRVESNEEYLEEVAPARTSRGSQRTNRKHKSRSR